MDPFFQGEEKKKKERRWWDGEKGKGGRMAFLENEAHERAQKSELRIGEAKKTYCGDLADIAEENKN